MFPASLAAAAVAFILTAVGGAFFGLITASSEASLADLFTDARLRRVAWFTLMQAGLSTILSVGLAVPLARALARQDAFPGRTLILRLLALPPVLPALVAVLGIVSVYGGNGWINAVLNAAGAGFRMPLYGLTGILVAHVFFNLPLAARLLLLAWQAVPADTWRIAAQLGMGAGAIRRQIEAPLLRRHVPGIAAFVFLLCVLSFTTVLTLGGGPAATTLEVAIYQALRFDFAPERAAALALAQLALCLALVAAAHRLTAPMALGVSLRQLVDRPDRAAARATDLAVIGLAALFVGAPLAAVVVAGAGGHVPALLAEAAVWRAIAFSLVIAAGSAALATALAGGLLAGARRLRQSRRARGWADPLTSSGLVALAVPPLVLAAGWFILLNPLVDPATLAIPAVITVNALMSLPYVLRALAAALADLDARYGRLAAALGITGWARLRLIDWVHIRAPVGFALGFSAALSLGDLGAIALFGGRGSATLPLLLYQRMGAYRLDEAAGLALILAVLSLAVFAATDRLEPRRG